MMKNISIELFKEVVKTSYCIKDVLVKLGNMSCGGNYKTFHKYVSLYNIDTSHFNVNLKKLGPNKPKSLDDVLCVNSNYSRTNLKHRLIKCGLLITECAICSLHNTWNGKELVLILDHINGVNNDNQLENLRLLCPNCNSQQPTFAGRNVNYIKKLNTCIDCGKYIINSSKRCNDCNKVTYRKVKNRPTSEELQKLIHEYPMTHIGDIFNVSDNAVRKWCKTYGIEIPKRHGVNSHKNAILKE